MRQDYLDEYFTFLRFPSVSTDQKYAGKVSECADWLSKKLGAIGLESKVVPTKGHPVVWARNQHKNGRPTVLVYGHYDVQPPDPLNLWDSPPFEPVIKDEKIYARGSCDDKGQVYMHIKAFELMMKNNAMTCNVKFMIEGEEEVGSSNLGTWIRNNKERLKGDVILI